MNEITNPLPHAQPQLARDSLREKTRDMHLQYYSLILGVGQNVVLALFMSRLGRLYTEMNTLHVAPDIQFVFNISLTLTLIVFVYYSYYSFMLFYTHMLRMRDILHPTFLTLAQAGLIYNLETCWEFYAFTALFFFAASCAICSCWAYTDFRSLGETASMQAQLAKRFRGHFLVCLIISALGCMFSAFLAEIGYIFKSDGIVTAPAPAFAIILFIYRIQERRFVKSIFEITGTSPGQYKFIAGLRELFRNDAWCDAAAALGDAFNSCKLQIERGWLALKPDHRS